jgi:phosphoribosyl-AMP cyclohydrolase
MGIQLDPPYDGGSIEGTNVLKLDFNKINKFAENNEVIPVAVQNSITGEIILIAYTNEAAFNETVKQRKAIFWSTSRNKLWFKGEESGNTFTVQSIYVNCEQNSLVYKVTPDKDNICHTSINNLANNCFYRELDFETLELKVSDNNK